MDRRTFLAQAGMTAAAILLPIPATPNKKRWISYIRSTAPEHFKVIHHHLSLEGSQEFLDKINTRLHADTPAIGKKRIWIKVDTAIVDQNFWLTYEPDSQQDRYRREYIEFDGWRRIAGKSWHKLANANGVSYVYATQDNIAKLLYENYTHPFPYRYMGPRQGRGNFFDSCTI
jgi:hypothetical protein